MPLNKKPIPPYLALVATALLAAQWPASAQTDDALAEGGRLYDMWWAEYGLRTPKTTHPSYPAAGKKSGATTWRCKECHGWDYKGAAGAYGKGSHFTGIGGIRSRDGGGVADVVAVLKDANHGYQQVMLDGALDTLARFVVQGQLDTDKWIDPATKQVKGDVDTGRRLFDDKCARCHGDDGRNLNFKTPEKPEYIGTIAQENPWELLHKIRNGQPGSRMPMGPMMMGRWRPNEAMPNFRNLSEAEQAAIAAFAQTLPEQ